MVSVLIPEFSVMQFLRDPAVIKHNRGKFDPVLEFAEMPRRRSNAGPSSKLSNNVLGATPSPEHSLRSVSMLAEKLPCSIRRTVSADNPLRCASASWVTPRARRRLRTCFPNSCE
jgi:hypothetical protein